MFVHTFPRMGCKILKKGLAPPSNILFLTFGSRDGQDVLIDMLMYVYRYFNTGVTPVKSDVLFANNKKARKISQKLTRS
jgi:hypothetical protein